MDIFPVVPGMTLELGKTGTHYVRAFRFDISAWQEAYPDGIINLIHRMPDANEPYVAGYLRLGEGYIDWVVQSSDVAVPGYGECELVMIVDGVAVDKTDTYPTHIEEQLGTNSVTPPTGATWVEQVLTVGNATLQAVEGFEDLVAEKEQDITDLASGKEQDITDLAAQKIAAIEAKGAQTLDSIPDDYSELSGDVDELKGAFDEGVEQYGYYEKIPFTVDGYKNYTFNVALPAGEYLLYLKNAGGTEAQYPVYLNDSSNYTMLVANIWQSITFAEQVKSLKVYIGSSHGTGDSFILIAKAGSSDVEKSHILSTNLFEQNGYYKEIKFSISDSQTVYFDVDLEPNIEYDICLKTPLGRKNQFPFYENYRSAYTLLNSDVINKVSFTGKVFHLEIYLNYTTFGTGDYTLTISKAGSFNESIPYLLRIPFDVTAGVSATHEVALSLQKGDKIAVYVDTGFAMLANVGYYAIDANGTRKLLGTAMPIRPKIYTMEEFAKGIAVYIGSNYYSKSDTYYLCVQKLSYDEQPVENHIYLNAADNNLYQTIESYKGKSSQYNRYYFHLNPGTYDLASQFTDAEINSASYSGSEEGFVGLTLYDGMYLVGKGSKEQIIVVCDISTTYDIQARRQISTLNTKGYCGAKNITFISKNIRYVVHDDFNKSYYSKHIFENCAFVGNNINNQDAYGAGMCGGLEVVLNDCYFYPSVGFHTNSFTEAANVVFNNCKAKRIRLADSNSKCISNVRFNNCDIKYIEYNKVGTSTNLLNIEGVHTKAMVVCYADFIPKVGIDKYYDTQFNVGNCLTYGMGTATGKADFYGVVIGKDSESVYIQHEGFVPLNLVGLTGVSVGDYLTVSSGALAITENYEDAVAVVCNRVDALEQNIYFAKII